MTLGKDGLPVRWDIEGKGWVGAPVKESFAIDGNKASWTSLDDKGEAAGAGLYVPNNSSPWSYGVLMKALLAAPQNKHAVLPGGELRLEKIKDIPSLGATAYALWGIDVTPTFLLGDKKGRFIGLLYPGWVGNSGERARRRQRQLR